MVTTLIFMNMKNVASTVWYIIGENKGKTKIHRKSQSQSHIADKNRNRNGKVKIAIANLTIAEKNHKSQSRNSAIAMPLEALKRRLD